MQKRIFNYAFMGICTIGVAGLYSCVDNAYDLNNEIDKTITVGGDLTVPTSSTEEMFLKNILNLGDDSAVKAGENGDYSILQTGNPSKSEVKVSEVNIETNESSFENINLTNITFTGGSYNISGSDASINIEITQEDIEKDIVDIESAIINGDVPSSLNLKLSNNTSGIIEANNFYINSGFEITFPEYMIIESISDFCTADKNILKFRENRDFNNDGKLPIEFRIKEILFKDHSGAKFENNTITLGDDISFEGYIISRKETTDKYNFYAGVDCNDIKVESANAIVNPNIEIKIDPIEINNLPDFLTEEGVVFDATDPRIFLTVSNNSPLDADVNMNIVAEKKGIECGKAYVSGILIPGNVENHVICIHKDKSMHIPGITNVYCEELSEVIKNIPDRIRIENINTKVHEEFYDIEIGKSFTINNSYEINTPLMFGTETNIEYKESIDIFNDDLEDAEFNQLELNMKAINKIPMNLILSAEAIDNNGNLIENATIDTTGDIEASNGTDATEKDVNVIIKAKDGTTIKNFNGLKLKITGTATEATRNVSLNENQSLKLDNLKLKVTGGITMDLN